MKGFKIALISVLLIFVIMYLAFLFVLPYAVDLDKYSPQIIKAIQDNTNFQVDIKGLKIKTFWNLSAGTFIDKTDLKYPTGKKFAQINGLQVKVSLLPLLWKNVAINKIEADKVFLNLETDKKGEFLLNNFCCKNSPQKSNSNFKLPEKMPDIVIKKYRISFINAQNTYSMKGTDLKISNFIRSKKIKVKTKGDLILNKRKQISYDIAIFSEIFPESKKEKTDLIKIFDDLYKYNINTNIDTDLVLKNKGNYTDIEGKINLDKISFAYGGKIFPKSTLKLDFQGNKAKINSSLKVDEDSKAVITGFFKTGENKFIDMQVISDKLDVKDIILIAQAMSKPLGLKSLQNISANGFLKANFNIKSDFKKVQSNGYLKIENADITDKLYNVVLSSVNADIDFSQDAVKIKQAKANLNGQPITIKGTIDEKANADISILANNLQLKSVLLAAGQTKILKENNILNGEVNVKAYLKGRLNKASPKVNILISNVNLKNKKTKTQIKLAKAVINSNYEKENKGKAEITGINIYPSIPATISIPKINLIFDKKDLNIEKTYLYINNIRTNLSGKISDVDSNPSLNSLNISIPNRISLPIKGYAGSSIILSGSLTLNGDLYKPQINGNVNIPSVSIPSASTFTKNITLQFNKDIIVNCPQAQIANSLISFNAQVNNDFSNGIVVKNINFKADNIDLNYLTPIFKSLPKNSGSSIIVLNGKSSIGRFKAGRVISTNITSDIALKNNVLYLNNLLGDSYFGKIGGNVYYDFINKKTNLDLQGRGLSANPALTALTGKNDGIKGQLDFDSNISMTGYSKNELLRSLNGKTKFIISNGQMSVLGKFEHLLYAQNIISNSVFKATLNAIAKAITVKNTGVYKYMKGEIESANGWADVNWIKTSGPSMSLYISGRCYLPDNTANLVILGRISDDVVRILGPIGEFSMDKAISYIPKTGEITSFFASQFTTNPNYENILLIPYLTPKTEFPTKEFKVIIDGDVQKQSSVKSFKWLSRPKVVESQNERYIAPEKPAPEIPDFVKNLPNLKN